MITFRDGLETLVVESSYVTDSPRVGWILPLPAAPTKLQRADPGLLLSLSACLRPRVTHDLYETVRDLGILASFTLTVVLIMILSKGNRGILLVMAVFFFVFSFGLLMPHLGVAGGDGAPAVAGINEILSQRVGNYDVTVLSASGADAVSAWLAANSLRGLDAKARDIIDDYAGKKWCFLVARIQKEGGSLATPHPILAEFPTASIVYPMKLTAIAGSVTRVELFVAADSQAAAPGFECVAADRFEGARSSMWDLLSEPNYRGKSTGFVIGNPDAGDLLWPGCVVTRLVANLTPEQMAADVVIQPKELVPYRQHFFSAKGRAYVISAVALVGGIVLMLWAGVVFDAKRNPKWIPNKKRHLKLLGGWVLVIALVCAGLYGLLPVTPVYGGSGRGYKRFRFRLTDLREAALVLKGEGFLSARMRDEQLAKFPELAVREGGLEEQYATNPMTGKKMRLERSQWNFSVRREGDRTYLCFYDENCSELRVDLSEAEP